MKKHSIVFLAAILFTAQSLAAQIVTNLNDIDFWVGSGSKQAGLLIDFDDGFSKQSFVWGYRWEGVATGAEMITAVAAADPNLTVLSGGTIGSNFFIIEIGYFDGVNNHNKTSGDFITDFNYWGYSVVGGTAGGTFGPDTFDPVAPGASFAIPSLGTWTEAPAGASYDSFGSPGRILENMAWDAWSFGEFPNSPQNTYFAAIPEPGVSVLLIGGSFCFLTRRRRAS